ncbi:methyl-accepting chemotaxis protein [Methylobacterium sp. CM6247]
MKTVRSRLLVAIFGLLIALFMTAALGLIATNTAEKGMETVFIDRVVPLRDLKGISDRYAIDIVDTSHKVRSGERSWSEGIKVVTDAQAIIAKRWSSFAATKMDERETALANKAKTAMAVADTSINRLLNIFGSKSQVELESYIKGELYKAIDPVSFLIVQLSEIQEAQAKEVYEQAAATYAIALEVRLGVLVFGILAAAFSLVITMRGVLAPLSAITKMMRCLAGGDVEQPVPSLGRSDEIGDMAASVQVFKDNLLRTRQLEAETANARLAAEGQRKVGMRQMADAFETAVGGIIDAVSSSATELQATAQQLTSTAAQTAAQSATVAAAAEEAAVNVNTVASAAEELGVSVQEIGRQVSGSSDLAQRAVGEADRTAALVQELSTAVARIGDVVQLISTIAGQTNLLALNATIEAARAGEAGRGFAVVASEVKELANQTARATSEIGEQISHIQGATSQAVDAIGSITARIAEINMVATTIASAVEQQGAATQEIVRNVAEASTGTFEVTSNISGVAQASQEAEAAAGQVLGSASELSRQSEHLSAEVQRFLTTVRAA